MLKLGSTTSLSPTVKAWLWSHRALFVGFPLLLCSASSLPIQASSVAEASSDPLANVTVTTPPAPALDFAIPLSSPLSLAENATDAPAENAIDVLAEPPQQPARTATAAPQTAAPAEPRPPETIASVPVRIGIARWVSKVEISASTPAIIMDASGQQLAELSAESPVRVRPQATHLQMGALALPQQVWIKPNAEGLVAVNGRWYRGSIQLILDRQRIVTVNHLDLEAYLYSVVGAEMPASWPIEALKAQAIAARSYALARISSNPASRYFDLGDTPRWQAYKGLTTETNTTHEAVNSTQGLLISHRGAVVESLYASTQHLVQNVHKGYGMSQNGAHKLARQAFNHRQILNHFYPGTTLTWLQSS